VELELLVLLRIHPVVNVGRILKYQEQIEEQEKIPSFPVKIEKKKKYIVKKILDK